MDQELQISDIDYQLPTDLIAQEPCQPRSYARLLVVDRQRQSLNDRSIRDLPDLLAPGDLLAFNDTKVVPARLFGKRVSTSGKWEGLYLRTTPEGTWELLSHTHGYIRAGEYVELLDRQQKPSQFRLQLEGRTPEKHLLVKPNPLIEPFALLDEIGHVPIPCYIRKGIDRAEDREHYQTVFATHAGSVAAPTAGLHFTPELLDRLNQHGIQKAFVTLHVGFGTFQPIKTERLSEHRMHSEWCELSQETVQAINACRTRGNKVVAVGTTTVRTLESAFLNNNYRLHAWQGPTDLFIRPPYSFHTIDGLLTNFHLPRSTLLILVSAFAGRELMLRAYQHAINKRYRFFSYGDAMLIV